MKVNKNFALGLISAIIVTVLNVSLNVVDVQWYWFFGLAFLVCLPWQIGKDTFSLFGGWSDEGGVYSLVPLIQVAPEGECIGLIGCCIQIADEEAILGLGLAWQHGDFRCIQAAGIAYQKSSYASTQVIGVAIQRSKDPCAGALQFFGIAYQECPKNVIQIGGIAYQSSNGESHLYDAIQILGIAWQHVYTGDAVQGLGLGIQRSDHGDVNQAFGISFQKASINAIQWIGLRPVVSARHIKRKTPLAVPPALYRLPTQSA